MSATISESVSVFSVRSPFPYEIVFLGALYDVCYRTLFYFIVAEKSHIDNLLNELTVAEDSYACDADGYCDEEDCNPDCHGASPVGIVSVDDVLQL